MRVVEFISPQNDKQAIHVLQRSIFPSPWERTRSRRLTTVIGWSQRKIRILFCSANCLTSPMAKDDLSDRLNTEKLYWVQMSMDPPGTVSIWRPLLHGSAISKKLHCRTENVQCWL